MRVVRIIGLGCLAAALAACSHEVHQPEPTRPEVTAPANQKNTVFSQQRSAQNLGYARTLRQSGDAAQARRYAEAAVNDWPASVEAWSEYQAVCKDLKDAECHQHAAFFHDKVDSMNGLPPRVAVLGLQNLLESHDDPENKTRRSHAKTTNSTEKGHQVDEWTYAMAQRMMAYYDRQDTAAALRDAPVKQLLTDTYPPSTVAGTAIGVGVVGYGIYQIAK